MRTCFKDNVYCGSKYFSSDSARRSRSLIFFSLSDTFASLVVRSSIFYFTKTKQLVLEPTRNE